MSNRYNPFPTLHPQVLGLSFGICYSLNKKLITQQLISLNFDIFFRLSTCGTTVTQNLTYIQNPSYPTGYTTTGNCIFTVTPLSTGRYRTIHKNYQVRPPVWVMFVCLFKQPIIIGSSQHPRNKFWVLCIDELQGRTSFWVLYVDQGSCFEFCMLRWAPFGSDFL